MLCVCQQLASFRQQYSSSFFIISYYSFRFTSAYNSILFCCLRRNVKPCCHNTRSIVIVYSARTTQTVTLSHVALGGRIPAVYDQRYKCHNLRDGGRRPPATMFTSPRLLQRQQQAYMLRIAISAYPTCIRRPLQGGSRRNIAIPFGMEKLEWRGCPTVKFFRRYLYAF